MLKFIGRGSAFNTKEGNTSAYEITEQKQLILLDCGEDVFHKIKPVIDNNDIEQMYIFISHLNSDHCGSLSSLLFYLHYVKKNINYTVICGEDNYYDLKQLLILQGNKDQVSNLTTLSEWEGSIDFEEGSIFSIKVNHIEDMNCYGFIVTNKNKELAYYSGDSNEISKLVLDNLDKFTVIYQDTCLADYEGNVHLSLRKLCELIPKEHRGKVYCMHLDCNELIEKAKLEGFNVVEVDKC